MKLLPILILILHQVHSITFTFDDPDYFSPSSIGGPPQSSGGDGSIVIITKQQQQQQQQQPQELRSNFFYTGLPQSYVVPGDPMQSPYEVDVVVKVWGAGGGGCDGGRRVATLEETQDLDDINASSGVQGGYVQAKFSLAVGERLSVDVGGGGQSRLKESKHQTLLGGLGGYGGGKSGYRDRSSEGGGGGGMSKISLTNGKIIAAAFGGDGGGNSTYCSALGGLGGRLRGMNGEGYINSELALVDNTANKENDISSSIDESTLDLASQDDQWIPITIMQGVEATNSEANTTNNTWCEHSSHRPTGRRGHSMTVVNNRVYIFGGATSKCRCTVTNDKKKHCSSQNVYSNELWHFDIPSATFTLLEPSGEDVPRGREQHSATVLPNGDILVIGGLSSLNETITEEVEPLNEVWRLSDPHRVTSHVISGINSSDIKLPMELNQTYPSSHTVNVDLGDGICVEDVQLSLSLDHDCPQGIDYISLTSPSSASTEHSTSSQRVHRQTKLFVSTAENRERDCNPSRFNISFSDTADEPVLSYSQLPNKGTYIPASSLKQTFQGLTVDGEWKLTISTSKKSLVESTASLLLLEWKLHLQTKSCTSKVKWEKISDVPPSFHPRHGHTVVAVEPHSLFISGGFAHRRLNDLWRFNYLLNTWTRLNTAPLRNNPVIQRQAAVLGPWGLLHYGGLKQRSGSRLKQGRDLSIQNLFTEEWYSVNLSGNGSNIGPVGRYLTSVALMDSSVVINKLHNIDGPFLLLFGGDRGHSVNAYPNSYGFMPNTFLDDVWLLSPSELHANHVMNKDDYCGGRLDRDSTQYEVWNATCGWWEEASSLGGGPGVCELREILIMAWCREQYQPFHIY